MIPSTKPPKHLKMRVPRPPAEEPVRDQTPPKIEIRGLNFFYGAMQSLHNISMSLADRSISAFIGPSGCGKSTLLRVMNRMYGLYPNQRAEGEVLIGGRDVLGATVDVAELRYRVGMVFQKPTPFPMSVFENVAFGLRLAGGIRGADLQDRVDSHDLVETYTHRALNILLEACEVEFHAVTTDRNLGEAVIAVSIRDGFAAHVGGVVGERDFNSGQCGASRIRNAAEDASARALGRHQRGTDQAQAQYRAQRDKPAAHPGRFRRHGTDPPDLGKTNFTGTLIQLARNTNLAIIAQG